MAINAYVGLMGSGKSFEVVANVILPAILKGRRVVSNIDGISEQRIHDYFLAKDPNLDHDSLGSVFVCNDDQIRLNNFFPDEKNPELDSVVKPGDLVVVDEAWRHWNRDQSLLPHHMQFFRMHRHYTHPDTGVCCDVALIFQSINDVHRSVRSVIEMTIRTVKIKTLGLATTYRLEFFEGQKVTKSTCFSRKVQNYDKKIFPLYQSYSGTQGKELVMDKRQNVLLNPLVWLLVGGVLALSIFSFWFLSRWFARYRVKTPVKAPVTASKAFDSQEVANPTVSVRSPAVAPSVADLRISGEVVIHGMRWVVLLDGNGHFRLENPALFFGRGVTQVGTVDGKKVATWTGTLSPSKDSKVGMQQ